MLSQSKSWLLISLSAFCSMATASLGTNDSLNARVRSILTSQHVPGAAIAVVRNGKVLDEIVFGSANLQLGVPVQRTTKFQLASVTKVFSAVALFRLEQEGKLNVNDPVSKYLSGLPSTWTDVTLRELASHTSGLPDIIANPNKPLSAEELNRTGDQALAGAEKRKVTASPGARFQYDQTNYLLIKRVIEKLSGHSFRKFVTAEVLNSRMPNTQWGDARSIVFGRSDMYTALNGDHIENGSNLYTYPEYLEASAGLNSTIQDMEQFAASLTTETLLTASELSKMWQPARDRRGRTVDISKEMEVTGVLAPAAGWFYADNSEGKFPRMFMTGGSSVSIMDFPKQRLCVVVLTNVQAKDDPLPIAETVATAYLPGLKPMF